MSYIVYNKKSIEVHDDIKDAYAAHKRIKGIMAKTSDPEAEVERIKAIMSPKSIKKKGVMDLSIVKGEEEKAVLLEMADFEAIRAILKKYGLTGCSHCDLSDREIVDWIIFNRDKGNLA